MGIGAWTARRRKPFRRRPVLRLLDKASRRARRQGKRRGELQAATSRDYAEIPAAMSSGPGNIIIRIGAETAGAVRGMNDVNKSLGDTMTTGQKATAGLRKAALPAAAALGAIAIASVD